MQLFLSMFLVSLPFIFLAFIFIDCDLEQDVMLEHPYTLYITVVFYFYFRNSVCILRGCAHIPGCMVIVEDTNCMLYVFNNLVHLNLFFIYRFSLTELIGAEAGVYVVSWWSSCVSPFPGALRIPSSWTLVNE